MNDFIRGTGKSLFLCLCDLKNRINLESYFRTGYTLDGEVQITRPDKEGGTWIALQSCKYEAVSDILVPITKKYSFILSSGMSPDECNSNFQSAVIEILKNQEDIITREKSFVEPGKDKIWQALALYSYPV